MRNICISFDPRLSQYVYMFYDDLILRFVYVGLPNHGMIETIANWIHHGRVPETSTHIN